MISLKGRPTLPFGALLREMEAGKNLTVEVVDQCSFSPQTPRF
jgi:hypothetical protein